MPVKARVVKRRTSASAECRAWEMVFECGTDYFNELRPLGLDTTAKVRRAAKEAWQRLGGLYMRTRPPGASNRETPWALEQFGPP
jgi:hypothetical protein